MLEAPWVGKTPEEYLGYDEDDFEDEEDYIEEDDIEEDEEN